MITLNPVALEKEINDRVMAARKDERKRVLKELIAHYNQVIADGKGVTYNHPITYQWMYGGVVKYLEELRKGGEP